MKKEWLVKSNTEWLRVGCPAILRRVEVAVQLAASLIKDKDAQPKRFRSAGW